jgi:hypothetical protein
MPCTEARRLANQRNAQKSTGPKTEAGKRIARLNALSHGFRSEAGLVPRHLNDAVAKHEADLADAYRPEGGYQTWLIHQAADAAARLDSCQVMIRAQCDDQIDRAELCWDEDHDLAVEELAARLPKDPARVSRRLSATAHGCIWLLVRWSALNTALNDHGCWTESQLDQAFQLLGIPEPQRVEYPHIALDADPEDLTELVKEQIDSLESLYVRALHPLDLKERDLARRGIPLRPSAEMNTLQRYEHALRRVYNESLNQFRTLRAEGYTGPLPMTDPEPEPAPEPLRPVEIPQPKIEAPQASEPSPTNAPVRAMLAGVIARVPAKITPSPVPLNPSLSSVATPPKPRGNRKARKAQEKAARKARGRTR